MKKLYTSIFALVLGAAPLFAQSLTTIWTKTYDMEVGDYDAESPDWRSPGSIKTQAGMRNAIGVGGKLYGIDMRTMSVTAFDANGAYKAYDLPSLAGQTVTYTDLSEDGGLVSGPDFYGSLISRDDAGHLLIGHAWGTGASCNTWTVLDRNTGATQRLVADMGDNYHACLPIEIINRAIGDVTTEGYLYVPPTSVYWPTIRQFSWATGENYNMVQQTKILSFTGNGTVGGINVEGSVSGPAPLGCWIFNSTVPWYKDLAALHKAANRNGHSINQTFFLYSKLQGGCLANGIYEAVYGTINPYQKYNVIVPFTGANSDLVGYNYAMYEGFDTFELGNKRYYVAAYNDDAEFRTEGMVQFGIFDRTGNLVTDANGNYVIWSYDGDWFDEGMPVEGFSGTYFPYGSLSLNIEKVDEANVNIYLWAQNPGDGVVAAMFNFGNGNTEPDAVEEVSVDANVAPVYYNLNGIRVAEPENGIFIEKRGSKVTKVIK